MDPVSAIPPATDVKSSGNFGSVRLDPLEAVLVLGCLTWLLPGTWISGPLESGFWLVFNNLGVSRAMGPTVFYVIGAALLACLLIRCLYAGFVLRVFPSALARFLGAVILFASLYPLDFFLSTASPFDFRMCWWPFFVISAFFIVVLYLNRTQTLRIVQIVALVTGIQGICAIYFYLTGQHQFHTPYFGNRTDGTFSSPNTLYPLCLLGAPLCIALAEAQKHRGRRILFLSVAAANLLALNFTYMRSGWLGMAAAIVFLLAARRSAWAVCPRRRAAATGLLVCLLAAALFVRTKGEVIGTAADRSTLGRIQIWRVCLHVIAVHPWLGSGLSTYQAAQTAQMTPALEAFNPMNDEAKSLYLNVTAEFGCFGLALLLLAAWRYAGCIRATLPRLQADPELNAVLIGTTAGIVALAAAGLTDTPLLQAGRAPSTFALALLMGASAAAARDALSRPEVRASRKKPSLRRIGWIVGSLMAVLAVWTTISSLLLVRRAMPQMEHYISKVSDSIHPGMTERPPERFEDALIAAEDRNFYHHHGVDWEAFHSALRKDGRMGGTLQGGSTITMQAVRYSLLPPDKTPARKIAEMVLANRIEHRLTKPDILRLYCDSVGFGLHTAGLPNAARFYFDRKPRDLSLAECAFLVGAISHPPHSVEELTAAFADRRKGSVLRRLEQAGTGGYDAQILENARREKLVFAWEKVSSAQKELR